MEVRIKYQDSIILKYQHSITIEIIDRKYERSLTMFLSHKQAIGSLLQASYLNMLI